MNQDNNTVVPSLQGNEETVTNSEQVSVQVQAQVAPTMSSVTVSTNPDMMVCPRCGSEMKKDARYCMKCGQLNYAHPENESMKQYAWQSIKSGHFVSGANVENQQLSAENIRSISNVNPFKKCLTINIILHLLIGFVVYAVLTLLMSEQSIPIGWIIGLVISTIVAFIMNYSTQAVYIKAGEPWWGYFVPFYSNYIWFKITLGSGWIFLFMVLPVVNLVIGCLALYNLGKKFYKNGWLTLFFPFVMIPIIAFDKNSEYSMLAMMSVAGDAEIDRKGKTRSEREYGRKKFIFTTLAVVVVGAVLYLGWPYLFPIFKKIYEFFMKQLEFFK